MIVVAGFLCVFVSLWLTATPRKRLDRRLRKNPVRKFGLIAHPLARRRKQARGERLVPSVSEPRNIAQDPPDVFL